jgi:hypothetical protein
MANLKVPYEIIGRMVVTVDDMAWLDDDELEGGDLGDANPHKGDVYRIECVDWSLGPAYYRLTRLADGAELYVAQDMLAALTSGDSRA